MKIYFIFPLVMQKASRQTHRYHPFMPLGLLYIAAILRKAGHAVEIADRNELLIKNDYDFLAADAELLEKIRALKPQLIGFSATTPLMYDVVHFSKVIKENFPEITTVAGGTHPSAEPRETLISCLDIDLVVEGEGEITMLELAGRFPDFDVPGVWRRSGKNFCTVGKRELIQDLDSLPMPERDLLNTEFYTRPHIGREFFGRYATMFSSRGCAGRCNFCAGPIMSQGKIRFHSPDYVVEEMEQICSRYKVDYIFFADDMFLANRQRLESVCAKIKGRKLHKRVKWICQLTAASARLDLLKLMKESGCILIECGFESGSQEELDRMKKNTSIDKYLEFSRLVHRAGIRFRANMIKGYIDQSEKDFMLSADFIRAVKPYCTHFNQFWPLPGTHAYKELLKRGYKINWDDCTDFLQNFSRIPDGRFVELSNRIQKQILEPMNKKEFRQYHLWHHPEFYFKKIVQRMRGRI